MKLRKSLYCCGALILFSSIGFTTNTINAAPKVHHSHITKMMRHPKQRKHKYIKKRKIKLKHHKRTSKYSAYHRGFKDGKDVAIEAKINTPFFQEQYEDEDADGDSKINQIPYHHLWHAMHILPKANHRYLRGWYNGFQSINKPFMKAESIQDKKDGGPRNDIPNSLVGYKITRSHTVGGNPIVAIKRARKIYNSYKNPMIRQGLKAALIGGGFSYSYGNHAERFEHMKDYMYTANGYKHSLTLRHNKTFQKGLQLGWQKFDQGMFEV